MAHVGFDDVPLAGLLDPGITVIAQDPQAMGELAAQMLLRRLRDPAAAPETVEVPTRLIARGSGEIHAGRSSATDRPAAPIATPL